jgi:hypothetical protein
VSLASPIRSSNGSAVATRLATGQERFRPITVSRSGSIAMNHSEQVASPAPASGATIV